MDEAGQGTSADGDAGASGADAAGADAVAGTNADTPDGDDPDRGVETPEKLFSPEGDFMLIWGVMAGILTAIEFLDDGLPVVVLGGTIAAVALLAGATANATRRFRPPVGFYLLVTLAAGVGAGGAIAYTDAIITPAGYGVIALANAGRVYELGYRDSDSLLDPRRDDAADEESQDEDGATAPADERSDTTGK